MRLEILCEVDPDVGGGREGEEDEVAVDAEGAAERGLEG